jgi:hypothetical protein
MKNSLRINTYLQGLKQTENIGVATVVSGGECVFLVCGQFEP